MSVFDYRGRFVYHLVTVTHDRQPVLTGPVAVDVMQALERAASATSFELILYSIMPDHVHILAAGSSDDAHAIRLMQRFKQLTGFAYKKQHRMMLWQQSFFDHVARQDEDILPIVRYILGNPIEAGYVKHPDDWQYVGGTLVDTRSATSLHSLMEQS